MRCEETCSIGAGCPEDVHNIIGAALFALGSGARGVWIDLAAIESFRNRFKAQVLGAVGDADWRSNWREEEGYLLAQVVYVGRIAAQFAVEEGRALITKQDLELALTKARGQMPIAGRWCPV